MSMKLKLPNDYILKIEINPIYDYYNYFILGPRAYNKLQFQKFHGDDYLIYIRCNSIDTFYSAYMTKIFY